ncbi:MAG: putative metal-binding motif-containing protein, partial [Deltaproteobacteria bacterium]|nr:putative metal-binding motif-containing protein [Deltaproteobacteria bacterium]
MSRSPQIHPRCTRRALLSHPAAVLIVLGSVAVIGCGALDCPEPLIAVEGTCHKADPVTHEEPELGEPCGERAGVGECVEGEYVCTEDGTGVVCEGAVGPSDEVCDGKDNDCDGTKDNGSEEACDGVDNDCDGLVDEGVLSIKNEVFDERATVTAVSGGFVVTRIIADQLRVETYDTEGNRTGHHDDIEGPSQTTFLESDGAGQRVLVAFGQYSFQVVDAYVDSSLVPIILGTQSLHEDWKQGTKLGVYDPPYHPRVLAAPSRFLGYRDVITFALNPFADDDLLGLAQAPTVATEVPLYSVFDAAGAFVVWEQSDNLRAGLLVDDGSLVLDIDVARGKMPGIAVGTDGPGVVYVQDRKLRLTELGGVTLQCVEGRFCHEWIEVEAPEEGPVGPTALAFDEGTDTWFVMAGTLLAVVGRGEDGAIVKQAEVLDAIANAPNRVDVAVSG